MRGMKLTGVWNLEGIWEIENVKTQLAQCSAIDDLEIPHLEDWGFSYELAIYQCQNNYTFFFESDDEEGFSITVDHYNTLDDAKKAWNNAIDKIIAEINYLARDVPNEAKTELIELINEISGQRW